MPAVGRELLALPGIGEYTARAVAAFAFGARTPVVDTNVRRVLSRAVRGVDEPREPATAADRAEMDVAAAARTRRGGQVLGGRDGTGRAGLHRARTPDCGACPMADRCRWRLAGCRRRRGPARGAGLARHRPAGAGPDHGGCCAEAREPVPRAELTVGWPIRRRLKRCLASLIADGLARRLAPAGRTALPGPAGLTRPAHLARATIADHLPVIMPRLSGQRTRSRATVRNATTRGHATTAPPAPEEA